MEHRITATELARKLGDVLARVRYRGDSFIVERNGIPVARVTPPPTIGGASLRKLIEVWRAAGEPDPSFADDLERIGASDQPPRNPWGS